MRRVTYLCFAVALSLLAMPSAIQAAGNEKAAADSVTVEGSLLCAKCSLGEDREECQNAISVESENGADTAIYYLVANDVAKDYGHVCEEKRSVRATGTVSEEAGQTWLDASTIETLSGVDAANQAEDGNEHSH